MAKAIHYQTPLESSKFFHIYNRAIGKDLLFLTDENYRYFLQKYNEYLSDYVETYAYCLMGNHFHFLIRVKDELPSSQLTNLQDLSIDAVPHLSSFQNLTNVKSKEKYEPHQIISLQFKNLFIAYTKAFNKQHCRYGGLFQTPFKRVEVDSDLYFTRLVYYIHTNPRHHEIMNDFENYAWSSYGSLLSEKFTKLKREELMR
jgi:REP element-mobilizing transposase RayT